MSKLLRAGFIRYFKNTSFYVGLLASVIIGVWTGLSYREYDSFHKESVMGMFLAIVIVISISIGKEYYNGGFRNKIIIGHTKLKMFMSEWIINVVISTLFFVICSIPTIILNSESFADVATEYIIKIYLGMLFIHIAIGIVTLFICTIISHRAIAPIVSILIVVGMVSVTSHMSARLSQDKYMYEYIYNEETGFHDEIKTDEINPYYLDEPMRSIYKFAIKVMPQGQSTKYETVLHDLNGYPDYDDIECVFIPRKSTAEEQKVMDTFPLYSLGLIVFLTAAGCFIFRKKELK